MKIVVRTDDSTIRSWQKTLSELLPEATVYCWKLDSFNPEHIDYAVVWAPPMGMLASLPNLLAVFSVGAGISHITDDPTLPRNLPIIRTTGEDLRNRMCEYMLLHVLRIHRRLPEIEEASKNQVWNWIVEPTASSKTIGIMGIGNLGLAVARSLINVGYKVKGLSRTEKQIDGLDVYTQDQLSLFLQNLDILISILPGTKETENIIRKETLDELPKGAWVINVGRGSQVKDDDLISALNSGHLNGAVLDVFRQEPLPIEHPFWKHPKILITSHTASAIESSVGGNIIASNIQKFSRGEYLPDIVNLDQGY